MYRGRQALLAKDNNATGGRDGKSKVPTHTRCLLGLSMGFALFQVLACLSPIHHVMLTTTS